jgi:hypothetical protein
MTDTDIRPISALQLRLDEVPTRCCHRLLAAPWQCGSSPVAVLLPGPTGYCEEHWDAQKAFMAGQKSWREAFEAGRARWVEL